MVIGTGIDIVNIDRIERLMARWGDLFLGRVFTEKEIIYCRKRTRPPECFATRFAAKEAFLKALDGGFEMVFNGRILKWRTICWENPSSLFIERQRRFVKPSEFKMLFSPFPTTTLCRGHVLLEEGNHESSDR